MPSVREHLPATPRARQLSADQIGQLDAYARLLREFNRRINLISREDAAAIERLHIPHVLSLTLRDFAPASVVIDWGTGGGLPAIPLAIAFPDVTVVAVDAVEKKTFAVRTMARRLGLGNVHVWNGNAARYEGSGTHSISRATAPLVDLWSWHRRVRVSGAAGLETWRPGLICLKGGDLAHEIAALQGANKVDADAPVHVDVIPLRTFFADAYFETKSLVHVYERSLV